MSTETPPKARVIPKLVTLGNGLKLAESWVNNMSGLAADDESSELDFEGRPPRLGLGSKVILQSKMGYSTDPVERRLRYKLEAGKKRAAAKDIEELNPSETKVGLDADEDDNDEDPESRSSAFTKKRAAFISPSMQPKKKLK